jgi:hypothetical protein
MRIVLQCYQSLWERATVQFDEAVLLALAAEAQTFVRKAALEAQAVARGQAKLSVSLEHTVQATKTIWMRLHPDWPIDVMLCDVFKVNEMPATGLPDPAALCTTSANGESTICDSLKIVTKTYIMEQMRMVTDGRKPSGAATTAVHFVARAVDAHILQLMNDADYAAQRTRIAGQNQEVVVTMPFLEALGVPAAPPASAASAPKARKPKAASAKASDESAAPDDAAEPIDASIEAPITEPSTASAPEPSKKQASSKARKPKAAKASDDSAAPPVNGREAIEHAINQLPVPAADETAKKAAPKPRKKAAAPKPADDTLSAVPVFSDIGSIDVGLAPLPEVSLLAGFPAAAVTLDGTTAAADVPKAAGKATKTGGKATKARGKASGSASTPPSTLPDDDVVLARDVPPTVVEEVDGGNEAAAKAPRKRAKTKTTDPAPSADPADPALPAAEVPVPAKASKPKAKSAAKAKAPAPPATDAMDVDADEPLQENPVSSRKRKANADGDAPAAKKKK